MDDDFMLSAWRKPRPEFARELRARLAELDDKRIGSRAPARLSWIAAYAASVVLAVAIFAIPSVRAAAQAFLDLFRIVNFAPVPVQPDRIKALLARQGIDLPRLVGEQTQVLKAPGPSRTVETIEAAGAIAGIHIALPTWRPVGLEMGPIDVVGDQSLQFTASSAKLQYVLDSLGIDDLSAPAGIDGQTVTMHVFPIVRITFADATRRVALIQARQPEVSLPAGLNLAQLAQIALRLLGVDRSEAYRIAQSVDWRTTLILPIPADVSFFRQVNVQGSPGLLITTVNRAARGTLPVESRILWSANGSVFALAGSVRPDELFDMAQSVQ